MKEKKIVLTYGTFDLFHVGHLNLLERLKDLGDALYVGVSTDEFNESKGKKTIIEFEDRLKIISGLRCVDFAFSENNWDQKVDDIEKYSVSTFGMGGDWSGKFDWLNNYCEVIYLQRTEGVSSSVLKNSLKSFNEQRISELKKSLDVIVSIVERLS